MTVIGIISATIIAEMRKIGLLDRIILQDFHEKNVPRVAANE